MIFYDKNATQPLEMITHYFKGLESHGYNWDETYNIIQELGEEYFLEFCRGIFDMDSDDYTGGFIAYPRLVNDVLLENTIYLTKDKHIGVVPSGVNITKIQGHIPMEYSNIYGTLNGEYEESVGGMKGAQIVLNFPYATLSYKTGDTILWKYEDDHFIPQVLQHHLSVYSQDNIQYLELARDYRDRAATLNGNLHDLLTIASAPPLYIRGGFLHKQDLMSKLSIVYNSDGKAELTLSDDLIYTYKSNVNYKNIPVILGAGLTFEVPVSTPQYVQTPVDYNYYALYLKNVPPDTGEFIVNQDNVGTHLHYLVINVTNSPQDPPLMELMRVLYKGLDNPLGVIAINSNINVNDHCIFMPRYTDPPNTFTTTYYLPAFAFADREYTQNNNKYLMFVNSPYYDSSPIVVPDMRLALNITSQYYPRSMKALQIQCFGECPSFTPSSIPEFYNASNNIYGISEMDGHASIAFRAPDDTHEIYTGNKIDAFSRMINPFGLIYDYVNDTWVFLLQPMMDALFGRYKSLYGSEGATATPLRTDPGWTGPFFVTITWGRGGLNHL